MNSLARQNLKTLLSSIGVTVILACAAFSPAIAASNAPSWRGTAGSTFEEWAFQTNANPSIPESVINANGTPSATIDYNPPYGSGWSNAMPVVYGSAQGWWSIARGSIALNIINHPNIGLNASKDFQVQVTYWKDISQAPSVAVSPVASFVGKTTALVQTGPIMGGWYMDVWTFHADANANSETITVTGNQSTGSQVDDITVDTRYTAIANTAAQARSLPNETPCGLTGPVVTRSFETFFYLEDLSRAAGIRVNCAIGQVPPAEGTVPTVTGVIRTVDGERVIDQASVETGGTGSVKPLGMISRSFTMGLNPSGLLVKLWGRAHVTSDTTHFTVDDGFGLVRVELHGTATPPVDGSFVLVTGALGADSIGPVLRVARAADIVRLD